MFWLFCVATCAPLLSDAQRTELQDAQEAFQISVTRCVAVQFSSSAGAGTLTLLAGPSRPPVGGAIYGMHERRVNYTTRARSLNTEINERVADLRRQSHQPGGKGGGAGVRRRGVFASASLTGCPR